MTKHQTTECENTLNYLESLLKPSEFVQYSRGYWGIYDDSELIHSTEGIDGLIIWAEERKRGQSKISPDAEIFDRTITKIFNLLHKDEILTIKHSENEYGIIWEEFGETLVIKESLVDLLAWLEQRKAQNGVPKTYTLAIQIIGHKDENPDELIGFIENLIKAQKFVAFVERYEH